MELSKLILIAVCIIVFIHLLKNNKNNKYNEKDNNKYNEKDNNKLNNLIIKRGLKINDNIGHFPIPPSTSISEHLSESTNDDITIINDSLVANPSIVNVIRSGVNNKDSHYPKYYRKDLISGNTVGTTELKFAETGDKPSLAWSDENVSDYPKYYKSDFEGGLTNVGSFFDKNNRYVDITGPRTDANVGDICYTDKEGEKVCLENDKLMNVAPQVVNNKNNCGTINDYNMLQYTNYLKYGGGNNKVINGSPFYDGVTGNNKFSSKYEQPLKEQILSCSL